MNFNALDNKGTVEGFCLVKAIEVRTSSKGDNYLNMTLSDASGEINAKLWGYDPQQHGEYDANSLIKVRGVISVYAGSDQLRIDRIRPVIEADGVKLEDFVKTAEYDSEQMYNELFSITEKFEDKDLSRLVTHILEENRAALLYWPAAFKLHHAFRGGLLLHTLSIVRLAEAVCKIYPFVDRELLLSGAVLHDISKTTEYDVADTGIASGYSVRGNLLGHLAEGAMLIRKKSEELGIPFEKSMLLEHMVLSHHGEPEFGAAVRPMFIEAELLSHLDLIDAELFEMRDAYENIAPKDFTGKLWMMDNRKLYNHGRNDMNNGPKLF